jgi:DNA-binding NarL/FixJ family response regulator
MIKILIADDHSIVRSGLKKILKDESNIEIVGEAANHNEVLLSLATNTPDVVLLDISMPGKDGLDTLKAITTRFPKIKVLILSMHPEDRYAVRAIKAGASGYVSKQSATDELVNAIRTVCDGKKYISNNVAGMLADAHQWEEERPAVEMLSDREFQVLCMIAGGKFINEIGESLAISPSTVATYRARLMEKLKLETDNELVRYALRNNLID